MEKLILPWVVGVITKKGLLRKKILTQKRHIHNKEYDPLYEGTWEAVAGLLKPGEECIETLLREVREECGTPITTSHVVGFQKKSWTTGKGNIAKGHQPLCMLQNLGEPQKWFGPAFLLKVPVDWEPNPSLADGEAGEWKWWVPGDLHNAIQKHPEQFMVPHIPALLLACNLPQTYWYEG